MAIPNLLDPRMLSQVGETPPLQQNLAPVNLTPPAPAPTPPPTPPPAFVPPPELPMGLDAMPRTVTREQSQPTFAQILVKSIPLLLAGMAARKAGPGATSGLLAGYADAMEKRRLLEEKQYQFDVETARTEEDRQMRRQEYAANRQARIGTWMTSVVNSLQGIDDPASFAAAVKLYDDSGVKALGLPPGFITSQFGGKFDNTKAMTKAQKEAKERIADVKAGLGEHWDEAVADPNTTVTDPKTGKQQRLSELLATAGLDVKNAQGELVATTPKIKSAFDQEQADLKSAVQQKQKELGRPLTPEEIRTLNNQLRGEAAAATRAPRTPTHFTGLLDGKPTVLTYDDKGNVVAVKDANGNPIRPVPTEGQLAMQGQGKPIEVGTPEYKVAQDLATGKMSYSFFRTLVAYTKDTQKKFAIYQLASEINPNFNEADFERGFKFITNAQTGRQLSSLDNALSGVPDLIAASDAAARSGATALNKVTTPFKIGMGSKAFTDLRTAQKAWADEVSGALGFGTASDMKLQLGLDLTDANLSPANFKSAIEGIVVPFLERKRASILKQASVYGGSENNTSVDQPPPGAQGATGRGTGAGPAGGPPAPKRPGTVKMIAPDGKVWDVPADKVAAAKANGWK